MPLTQNVNGTLKKITKLTQNVSGTLKPLTSLKQNVSGTLKEVFVYSSIPTSLTWTAASAGTNTASISSETNNGMSVVARIYCTNTAISSSNIENNVRIYSSTFNLRAGNVITVTASMESSLSSMSSGSPQIFLKNNDTGTYTALTRGSATEITTDGTYSLYISAYSVTDGQSGYTYGTNTVTVNVYFANSMDDAVIFDIDLLELYPSLATALMNNTSASLASDRSDSNSVTSININTSNYKYLTVSMKPDNSIYQFINMGNYKFTYTVAFNGTTVATFNFTTKETSKVITLASSLISNTTLTSCTVTFTRVSGDSGTANTMILRVTPTSIRFYN